MATQLSKNLPTEQEPQRLQRRRRREQAVKFGVIEFLANHSAAVIRVEIVTFIYIDPPRSNDLPASLLGHLSRDLFPDWLIFSIGYLELSRRYDLLRIQRR